MNTTTIEPMGRNVETRPARPRLLYPALVIAAISVTLFSLIGIAALTGVMPSAHSNPQAAATAKAAPAGKLAQSSVPSSAPKARAGAAACVGCGTVESINLVETPAKTSGVGAVAGGLTGALLGNQIGRGDGRTVMTIAGGAGGAYLGNKIEQNTRRTSSYKIVVRMENGSLRTIYQTEAPSVAVGSQVQIVGNAVVARS
ncbi:MAG: glycine zipper 2TM domain-containing protein [Rhodocyclales bacterium]|nr:glycine zipper 2TM domain-containing protein [Rhodocyclales bacterium]